MLKKTAITSAILSTLLLSSSIATASGDYKSSMIMPAASQQAMPSNLYGEIIGQFSSPDGTVVGATLPGKNVSFSIPMNPHNGQYLHFAFMHAASASEGWFFAPKSEQGIELSSMMLEDGQRVDITKQIALFQASNAGQFEKVTTDKGKLKSGAASKFMKAELMTHNGMYIISIKNISEDNYKTPFSSGVWSVTETAVRSFDHEPSSALSKLATTGDRSELYKLVQKQTLEKNNTPSMELSKRAIKMAKEQMVDHKKIGSISASALTQKELENKFAMAATQMGAKYYVITGLSNKNHSFGNADIYE